MSVGTLIAVVYGNEAYVPLPSARVEVYTAEEELITALYTDISGKTQPLELSAPPIEYSLTEGEPKPYTPYTLKITADGYETVIINNVPIFSGSEAIQRITLKSEDGTPPHTTIINVPPPDLWGNPEDKLYEEEIKPLQPPTGLVVLDSVVIPEYVVVHDGAPSASAETYYVPYTDYIKNVASGEIYSTWPATAIVANVLAIQSFVLNRIYTEWYRSRGYSYSVTSSTRYDQSFSPDRTIYESINDVVDEYFTYYIKRDNQLQPLFAQYCDGQRVVCPDRLSQWGSAELAEQGYTAMEILKYYYGDDITLEQAYKVSGVPQSYPGTELTIGSVGESVRTIQNQLNTVSDTYSAIKKLKTDGIYGEETAAAVKTFQGIFNLPQTGVVNQATWYKISQLYSSLEKLSVL
jgi:hypothetical protein